MSHRLAELLRLRAFLDAEIDRLQEVRVALKEAPISECRTALSSVMESAATLYGVSVAQVLGDSRDRNVVNARQAAMWLLREHDLSYPQIGHILGRDHTTVMFGVRRVEARAEVRALLAPLLRSEVA